MTMSIKEKNEVGAYIDALLNERQWKQADLSKRLSELEGRPVSRDNVSKWIAGERYPGVDHIYYLAQLFGVSIENILMAGSQRDDFDDRPFSLYAVAKSGDKNRLDQLMNMKNEYGSRILENYDEFDKTILDYLIEFRRVDLIKYMFQKGYLSVWNTEISTAIRVGGLTAMEDRFNAFVNLALDFDDVELFEYLISRTRPILQKKDECQLAAFQESQYRRSGYVFSKELIGKLVHTQKILSSYMQSFTLSEEEWLGWNSGIVYYKKDSKEELGEIKSVSTISASFNLVLNYALLYKLDIAKELLDFAIRAKQESIAYLNQINLPDSYKISEEGRVIADSLGWGCVAIVGTVLPSVYQRLEGDLKEKAKLLLQE